MSRLGSVCSSRGSEIRVPYRQNGVGPNNVCAGAVLLKGHVPLGDWRVKLAVYMVNLLVLAVLQLQPYYGRSAAVVSERIQ
jgi:hypothetical protein